ncbi:MAG: catalase family peroxidase [Hydrogenophaga sp.]|nr:catalase family peroxidase [Hydrogenophaga sp.]
MKTSPQLASAFSSALLLGLLGTVSSGAQAQTSQPVAQVDALEGLFGVQAGFRRSGAKGVCASGHFVGLPAGRDVSSAAVFSGEQVPVVLRFSVGGGSPKASDKGRSVRGLAVAMTHPGGQQWQMANVSAPVFFVARPDQFAPFLQVRTPDPATGKPNPEKLKAFNDANPETLRQAAYLAKAPVPASYGSAQYWSTNAFELTNASNISRFARWQFVPEAGVVGLSDDELKSKPDDFLADELRQRVMKGPVSFAFQFQLAAAGDPTSDPTQAWPDDRPVVTAGRLVVTAVDTMAGGACDKLTFNPLVLPTGIKPSADPVLLVRAAPYALSLGRRLSEAKP